MVKFLETWSHQCERGTVGVIDLTWVARTRLPFLSAVGWFIVVTFESSFGYRFTGTSLKKVAPSQPARMSDELLTKKRVFMKSYGKIDNLCLRVFW
jgi:hypothetical protein